MGFIHFEKLSIYDQIDFAFSDQQFPCRLNTWTDRTHHMDGRHAHYGFVLEGLATLVTDGGTFQLGEGMFFSIGEDAVISGGVGLVFAREGFKCHFSLGGPRGRTGQLRYISGATTSVLIHPEVRGFPTLNLLCIPPESYQTMHVHPDIRLGLIIGGAGSCFVPDETGRLGREHEVEIPLRRGDIFRIPADGKHRFVTRSEPLFIVPWHAHTEDGVSDDRHYMLDRSVVLPDGDGNVSWLTDHSLSGRSLRDIE